MKLFRFKYPNNYNPKVGVITADGSKKDISSIVSDISPSTIPNLVQNLQNIAVNKLLPITTEIEYLPCVIDSEKFICVGKNYIEHIKETNSPIPNQPVLFSKFNNAICSAYDQIHIPKDSKSTDWEVELAVIIGKSARNIAIEQAENYIFGYCIAIDFSERNFQKNMEGQWIKGKSYDTFGPIGPIIATKDEIDLDSGLWLELIVNGIKYQHESSRAMIFNVPFLVHYCSQFFTLKPGDIIATGTPNGVAMGLPHKPYLKAGDQVVAKITNLGQQEHIMVQDY